MISWPRRHRDAHTLRHDATTEVIIGAAIEVHRELGPGLLESIYESALAVIFDERGIQYHRQYCIPVVFHGRSLGDHRADFIVADMVVIELKAVTRMDPVFDAQLLSYMRLGGFPIGLLINFNVPRLVDGLRRKILDPPCPSASVATINP